MKLQGIQDTFSLGLVAVVVFVVGAGLVAGLIVIFGAVMCAVDSTCRL